ncbi:kinase-like protein [Athelia psychrophila]|uniref:Kinase-like protein n=1 Tax=Athelia psychrophila TaxID=1759441 RepID=A0A167XBQ8_9AGAM|nr:kinase-like protein [Fibularhizoctonia sp. CBS 109695]
MGNINSVYQGSLVREDIHVLRRSSHSLSSSRSSDIFAEVVTGSQGADKKILVKQCRIAQDQNVLSNRERMFSRLLAYIQLAQRLNHPHVGKPLGLCHNYGPAAATVLPFYRHGNIVDHLKRHPASIDGVRLSLATELLKAVEYLHRKNIMHGNIRAENVLVDDDERAVLCDTQYKLIVDTDSDPENVGIDSSCRWTAPEALIGDPLLDIAVGPSKAADIYAVAMTIAQLWTLQPPFAHIRTDITVVATLIKLAEGASSTDRPDKVPMVIWAAIEDCLSMSPSNRPGASELLLRFERLNEGDLDVVVSDDGCQRWLIVYEIRS